MSKKNYSAQELCRLCSQRPAIKNSHVIPGFVFRAIKSDSPTGYFRNPINPNLRVQDGDKLSLLCTACEQRFGNAERDFAQDIFTAFHENDLNQFSYGPWLHYFMTSIAWRSLILDLPDLQSDTANPQKAISELDALAETMQKYLQGATNLADCLCNHAFVCTKVVSDIKVLAAAGPNVAIRRSVFGYSLIDRDHGYSGILHNLAGFMCFLIIKGKPKDTWIGTKVNPSGGELTPPQRVSSWLMDELLNNMIEYAPREIKMSDIQRKEIGEAMCKNPSTPSLRFQKWDDEFLGKC